MLRCFTISAIAWNHAQFTQCTCTSPSPLITQALGKAKVLVGFGRPYGLVSRCLVPGLIIIMEGLSLLQSIPPTTANKQNQAQKKRGSRARKLLGANAKSHKLKLKLKLSRLVSKAPTRLAPAGNPPPQLLVQRQLRSVSEEVQL